MPPQPMPAEAPSATAGPAVDSPYVGPRPFLRNEGRFFGRDREAIDLVCHIISHPASLLYAMSGAGKTSLINARLIPMLEEEERGRVLPVARVHGPIPRPLDLAGLANPYAFHALQAWAGRDADPARLAGMELKDYLVGWAAAIPDDEDRPLIAIFDQFEEMFTAYPDRWLDRRGFFKQVREALAALPRLRVLFAMREDHVASLDPYAALLPEGLRTRYRMERLRREAALEAITRPLEDTGRRFADGVAEQLVDDLMKVRIRVRGSDPNAAPTGELAFEVDEDGAVTGEFRTPDGKPAGDIISKAEFVEPVQLQVVCQTLWEGLAPGEDEITCRHLAASGDVTRALSSFYDRCAREAAEKSGQREGAVRRWFERRLITPAGTRGMVFRGPNETGRLPNEAVDLLQGMHLVRCEERGGARWYELTHDRFIEPILESNRRWRAGRSEGTLQALERRAYDWSKAAAQARPKKLLTEDELIRAEAWMAGPDAAELGYSDRLLNFLKESRGAIELAKAQAQVAAERREAREQARRNRELKVIVGGLIIAVGLVGILAYKAVTSAAEAVTSAAEAERQRKLAEANEAAAQIQRKRAEANEAAAQIQRKRAEANAFDALVRGEALEATLRVSKAPQEGVARADEAARLIQVARVAPGEAAERAMRLREALARKDSSTSAAQSAEQALRLALRQMHQRSRLSDDRGPDGRSPRPPANLPDGMKPTDRDDLNDVAFAPDGKAVAAGGNDGIVRIWSIGVPDDPTDDRLVYRWPADGGGDYAMAVNRVAYWSGGRGRTGGPVRLGVARGFLRSKGEGPGAAWVWLSTPGDGGAPVELEGHGGPVADLAFSPDGRRVATACKDGKVRVFDLEGGGPGAKSLRPVATSEPGDRAVPVNSVAFDGEGRRLVAACGNVATGSGPDGVWLFRTPTGEDPPRGTLEGNKLGGYDQPVVIAAFSPDGAIIAAGCKDGTVRVWEVGGDDTPSAPAASMVGHMQEVTDLAFTGDGARLVTASGDRTARVWDMGRWLDSGAHDDIRSMVTLSGHNAWVYSAQFSPDNLLVVTASYDGSARVWDARTGLERTVLIGHEGMVPRARFGPDSMRIATAGADGTARVWDAGVVHPPSQTIRGHTAAVRDAEYRPDGRRLVTACADGLARLWRAGGDGQFVLDRTLKGHGGPVLDASFRPDGRLVVTASGDRTARVWDLEADAEPVILKGHADAVTGATFSPDGRYILTTGLDDKTRLWGRAKDGTWAAVGEPRSGTAGRVTPSAFSPRSESLVTPDAGVLRVKGEGGVARVWEVKGLLSRPAEPSSAERKPKLELKHDAPVADIALSGDRRFLATANAAALRKDGTIASGSIRLWRADGGQPVGSPLRLDADAERVAFSPDGRRLAFESADGYGRVVEVGEGTSWPPGLPEAMTGLTGPAPQLVFNPDGSELLTDGGRLATDSGNSVARIWDLSGKQLVSLRGRRDKVLAMAFAGDGSIRTLNIWNLAKTWRTRANPAVAEPIASLRGPYLVATAAALSPDGRLAATGGADGTTLLWDTTTGRRIAELKGHRGRMVSIAFDPRGEFLVTASWDKTARLWRVPPSRREDNGPGEGARLEREVAKLEHEQPVNAAKFSPEGDLILTASGDLNRRRAGLGESMTFVRGSTKDGRGDRIAVGPITRDDTTTEDAPLGVNAAAFDRQGRRVLLACGDNFARVIPVELLGSLAAGGAQAWASAAGMKRLEHGEPVLDAAFSPGGHYAVTASADNTARVWDLRQERPEPIVLQGHTGDVSAASFSPAASPDADGDGRFVVTVSRQDGTARVWDARTGDVLYVLGSRANSANSAVLGDLPGDRSYTDDVNTASFSPDGRSLVTANGDGVAQIYALDLCGDLGGLIELADRRTKAGPARATREQARPSRPGVR